MGKPIAATCPSRRTEPIITEPILFLPNTVRKPLADTQSTRFLTPPDRHDNSATRLRWKPHPPSAAWGRSKMRLIWGKLLVTVCLPAVVFLLFSSAAAHAGA